MDWDLTEDQRLVRDMVREFVDAEVIPNAPEWDHDKVFPQAVFDQLGELGLFLLDFADRRVDPAREPSRREVDERQRCQRERGEHEQTYSQPRALAGEGNDLARLSARRSHPTPPARRPAAAVASR